MLSENASSDDVQSQQRSEEILVVLLRSHVIDQVTQIVPKKLLEHTGEYVPDRRRAVAPLSGGQYYCTRFIP